jgi:hypothetical protein
MGQLTARPLQHYPISCTLQPRDSIEESAQSGKIAFVNQFTLNEAGKAGGAGTRPACAEVPREFYMKRISVKRFYLIAVCSIFTMLTGCISSKYGKRWRKWQRHPVALRRRDQPARDSFTDLSSSHHEPVYPATAGFSAVASASGYPGNLSTVGQQNAALLGSWYRDFYAAQGILPAKGSCPAAGTVYVYADLNERTLQTAQGYVDGMFQSEALPDCGVQVVQSNKPVDPYIQTAAAGIANCAINTTQDLAAFNAQTGGANNFAALINTYSSQLQTLQTVTQCCQLSACITPTNLTPTSCTLLELPTTVNTTGAVSFASGSLFGVADTLTETFELEYGQGMPVTGTAQRLLGRSVWAGERFRRVVAGHDQAACVEHGESDLPTPFLCAGRLDEPDVANGGDDGPGAERGAESRNTGAGWKQIHTVCGARRKYLRHCRIPGGRDVEGGRIRAKRSRPGRRSGLRAAQREPERRSDRPALLRDRIAGPDAEQHHPDAGQSTAAHSAGDPGLRRAL